ncbi:hypothetical protein D3C79_893450 [compost metagenome]
MLRFTQQRRISLLQGRQLIDCIKRQKLNACTIKNIRSRQLLYDLLHYTIRMMITVMIRIAKQLAVAAYKAKIDRPRIDSDAAQLDSAVLHLQ